MAGAHSRGNGPEVLPLLCKHAERQEYNGQTGLPCLDKAVLARHARYQNNKNLPMPHPNHDLIGLERGHGPKEHSAQSHAHSASVNTCLPQLLVFYS